MADFYWTQRSLPSSPKPGTEPHTNHMKSVNPLISNLFNIHFSIHSQKTPLFLLFFRVFDCMYFSSLRCVLHALLISQIIDNISLCEHCTILFYKTHTMNHRDKSLQFLLRILEVQGLILSSETGYNRNFNLSEKQFGIAPQADRRASLFQPRRNMSL